MDNRIGFGETPALIVINFMKGYTTEGSPLLAPVWSPPCANSGELLGVERAAKISVLHTVVRHNPITFAEGKVCIRNAPVLKCLGNGNSCAQTCDEVRPTLEETV